MLGSGQAAVLPILLASCPPVPDTEQAFREFLVNERVCLHKALRGPKCLTNV